MPEPICCPNLRCQLVVCWPQVRGKGLLFSYRLREISVMVTSSRMTIQGRCLGCGRKITAEIEQVLDTHT